VKHAILVLFTLFSTTAFAQTYTVDQVPNVKLESNSYVSNPDNIISPATVAQIDSILTGLEGSATAQVAVVLLNSIGEEDIFSFAQSLFEKWGIGQASNDNGLLILMVRDQRTVRFHTGNGVEGLLPDATCKQIQRDHMVPYFKEGNNDMAMLQGVKAVDVLNNPEAYASETGIAGSDSVFDETFDAIPLYYLTVPGMMAWTLITLVCFIIKKRNKSFAETANQTAGIPKAEFTSGKWFLWFIVVPVGLMALLTVFDHIGIFAGGLYAYMGTTGLFRRNLMDKSAARLILEKNYQTVYNYYQEKQSLFSFLRFLFPIPFAFMYGSYRKKMQFFRDHPRDCKSCGHVLRKLDENADDKFLSKGQIREEQIKSIDYDVWLCASCHGNETLIYPNPDSKFSTCEKCKFKTSHVANRRTIRAATEYSEGQGEETHVCKHCGHQHRTTYSIAKISKSSSSSGSSSSSSGGSWGGGSSGGGGASSSW
jgi:uncharacterized protein